MEAERLNVVITADASQFKTQISQAKSALSDMKTASKKSINLSTADASKNMKNLKNNTDNVSKSVNNMGVSFKRAMASVGVVFGAVKVLQFFKDSIELASKLEEVQNVVDITFGDMSDTINRFAKSASKDFGLTELAAKQFSGTIGSMLNSMGITGEETAKMSMNLTALASDLSSFYNISQENAFEKIRSGISGETEPLKQLGINLSVANLEAYALSQGINASYDSMNSASQAILRYNYLMSVTKNQQGDFARTQASFANQTRLSTMNWTQLMSTIGASLKTIVKPFIIAFGTLAQVIGIVFEKINSVLGIKSKDTVESIQSTVESSNNLANTTNKISTNTGNAVKNVKELKKDLMGFDEISKLSGGGGISNDTGVSGGVSIPTFDTGSIIDSYDTLGKYANKASEELDKLTESHKTLSDILIGSPIATLITSISGAIGTFAIVAGAPAIVGACSAAIKGLIAIIAANPVATTAALITALAVAIAGLIKHAKEENGYLGKCSDEIKQFVLQHDKLNQVSDTFVNTYGYEEIKRVQGLYNEYEKLSSKTKLTTGEKQRLREVVQQLSDAMPELTKYINDEGTAFTCSNGEIQKQIDLLMQKYKTEAYEELIKRQYQQQAEAVEKLTNKQEELKESQEKYTEAYKQYVKTKIGTEDILKMGIVNWTKTKLANDDARNALTKYGNAVEENKADIKALQGVISSCDIQVEKYKNQIINLYNESSKTNKITKSVAEVTAAVEGVAKKIKDGIINLPSSMEKYGKNMMEGLERGIKNNSNKPLSAMATISDSIKRNFTNTMEIKSPSRLFSRYGKYIDLGLAQGIDGGIGDVDGVMGKLSSRISDFSPSINTSISGSNIEPTRANNTQINTPSDNKMEITLQIGQTKFGKAVVESINQLQRQTGQTILAI